MRLNRVAGRRPAEGKPGQDAPRTDAHRRRGGGRTRGGRGGRGPPGALRPAGRLILDVAEEDWAEFPQGRRRWSGGEEARNGAQVAV